MMTYDDDQIINATIHSSFIMFERHDVTFSRKCVNAIKLFPP